jgi:uncharacterized protein
MYAVLSPAKKLRESTTNDAHTPLVLERYAMELLEVMKGKTPKDLQTLMGISENLSLLNVERFTTFGERVTPSVLTFAGDTYQGLDAGSLTAEDLTYAQSHLGILSGLYGLLRPLDGISPYRLEMGTRLETHRGKTLYDFWGNRVTTELQKQLDGSGSSTLVNLASKEYFKVIKPKLLDATVITPVFKDVRKGIPKVISFLAKRARGMMARYIMEHQLRKPQSLAQFSSAGYRHVPSLSTPTSPVFVRQETGQ